MSAVEVTLVRSRFFEKPVEYVIPCTPGEGTHVFELHQNEVLRVTGDLDMSEGRGGRYEVGLHLSLTGALAAAKGCGAQGSLGYISLYTLESTPMFAFDEHGDKQLVATTTTLKPIRWDDRLTVLKPIRWDDRLTEIDRG